MQLVLKYVAFIAYIVLCVFVGILITLITPKQCISKKCLQKNELMLQDMDLSIKPCDNFYRYICGNYVGLGDVRRKSVTEAIKEKQIRQLSSYLNRPSKKSDNRVLRVIKMVYQSCLDTGKIEKEGVQPIIETIRKVGGFPLVEGKTWNTLITDLPWSLDVGEYNTRYTGFQGGYIFRSSIERFEDDKFYVHIMPPHRQHFTDTHVDAYFTYIKNITSILCRFNKRYFAPGDKEIEDTVRFLRELLQIERRGEGCKDKLQLENLEDFSNEFSFLGLKNYFSQILPYITLPNKIVVTTDSKVFFTEVKAIMNKTDKRTVSNCMMILNILEVTPLLPSKFRSALNELLKKTNSLHAVERDRSLLCTKLITKPLSSAVSALYLRDVFDYKTEQSYFLFLLATLKVPMRRLVYRTNWMDKETRRKAVDKLNSVGLASPVSEGTHARLTNKTAFRIYYEDLCYTRNTSVLNAYLALAQFSSDQSWELIEREHEVFDQNIDIFSSDITFDYRRNLVIVPMGFRNYPAFNSRWPKYLNYGGVGSKIAMELVRVIGFSGANFDVRGKRNNWWSVETQAEYKRRNRCFINQYNDYIKFLTDTEIRDGTCVEDIEARLAGVKISYLAYSTIDKNRFFPERRLSGLKNLSPKEMFFVDFATFYCDVERHPHTRNLTELEASEEPNEYKVVGSLRNLKMFSQLFGCSTDDAMNPAAKCDMWNR
uniref:Peptidase M13 N-terminal domain-containing protein n=1 Tax=Graphocephala atropunctata TaxID=36148 RepID=A0A1B6LUJ5_9HEMI